MSCLQNRTFGIFLRSTRMKLLNNGVRHFSPVVMASRSQLETDLQRCLPAPVASFVTKFADLCGPAEVQVCDGSSEENSRILASMEKGGMAKRLSKYDNNWLVRTDPADVARVESKTYIGTQFKKETLAPTSPDVKSILGNWLSPEDMTNALDKRFPGCMKGRTMYVVPFSMGPVGSPFSKIGIELTDSPYVVASMRVMTRMGSDALDAISDENGFVKCLHSVGQPLPMKRKLISNWPCNPEQTIIAHIPGDNMIVSFGSGYGGNSLLGKKCLALRMGSIMARNEGWLAEHMVIMGITPPSGRKRYIAAAFPSACGKTNLAMLTPSLPGYKIECVGDDIAWIRFDENGQLRAINPEYGFFGVAPGTSTKTNATALQAVQRNTIFTNTAETADGGFYWEGLENETPPGTKIIDWKGNPWSSDLGYPAAHPNSRFCSPVENCSILDPAYHSSEGVPIDAILFGGRRPEGVPLIYEAFDWNHAVYLGASMRSESTAAAEHKGKVIMHDPFAMRPFLGYNFGQFIQHWLNLPTLHQSPKLPRVFQVNWFRKGDDGSFLWPGFGENIRVLDWLFRRLDGEADIAEKSPIGWLPKQGSINMDGLQENVDWEKLFSVPPKFWNEEVDTIRKFLQNQVSTDLPKEMTRQMDALKERINKGV